MTLEQRFAEFRAAHPPASLTVAGREWSYLAAGESGPPVLLLTGVLGRAELGFELITALGSSYRVIAPDYPAVGSLGALAAGLAAILDAEGISAAHAVAGSFGGMVAQHWVRRDAGRFLSLVLSHTIPPRRAPAGGVLLSVMALLPERSLRTLFRRRLGGSFAGADPFWPGYFDAATAGLTRHDILARLRVAAEFSREVYGADDLAAWGGRVLIVEAGDDPLFRPERRQALRALYPGAQVHTFQGTGHAAAILRPAEYAGVIGRFLAEGV